MTITDKYAIPRVDGLVATDDPSNAYAYETSAYVHQDMSDEVYLYLFTPYNKAKIQYTSRRRYLPSYVAQHDDPDLPDYMDQTAEEVWNEGSWGDWFDLDTQPVALSRAGRKGTFEYNNVGYVRIDDKVATFSFKSGGTTIYDCIQIRFRACSTGKEGDTEWDELVTNVYPIPYISALDYVLTEPGLPLQFKATSTYERPFQAAISNLRFLLRGDWSEFYKAAHNTFYLRFSEGVAETNLPYCPAEKVRFDLLNEKEVEIDSSLHVEGATYEATPEEVETDMVDPLIELEFVDGDLHIEIPDNSFTRIYASLTWTDPQGGAHTLSREMEIDDSTWSAVFEYPPFDVLLTATLRVERGGSFERHTATITQPNDGKWWFSHMGEHVTMEFNVPPQELYSPKGEYVEVAGRPNPVARYGVGGKRDITLQGTLVNPDIIPGTWRPEFSKLEANHNWTFRSPKGDWRQVMVTGTSLVYDKGQFDRLAKASVTMVEVDGGLV